MTFFNNLKSWLGANDSNDSRPFFTQTRIELSHSDDDEDLKGPDREIKKLKNQNVELQKEISLLFKELREVKDNNNGLNNLRKKLDSNLSKEKSNYKSLEEKLQKEKTNYKNLEEKLN